jgi:hypothetical protein
LFVATLYKRARHLPGRKSHLITWALVPEIAFSVISMTKAITFAANFHSCQSCTYTNPNYLWRRFLCSKSRKH